MGKTTALVAVAVAAAAALSSCPARAAEPSVRAFGGLDAVCVQGCQEVAYNDAKACGDRDDAAECKEALLEPYQACLAQCGGAPAESDQDDFGTMPDLDGAGDAGAYDNWPEVPEGQEPVYEDFDGAMPGEADETGMFDGWTPEGDDGQEPVYEDFDGAMPDDAGMFDNWPEVPEGDEPAYEDFDGAEYAADDNLAGGVDPACIKACATTYATCVQGCDGDGHCIGACASAYQECGKKCVSGGEMFADADVDAEAPEEPVADLPSSGVDSSDSFPSNAVGGLDPQCLKTCATTYATCVQTCEGDGHCIGTCASAYQECGRNCVSGDAAVVSDVDPQCVHSASVAYGKCLGACGGESHCLSACAKTYQAAVHKCLGQ